MPTVLQRDLVSQEFGYVRGQHFRIFGKGSLQHTNHHLKTFQTCGPPCGTIGFIKGCNRNLDATMKFGQPEIILEHASHTLNAISKAVNSAAVQYLKTILVNPE